MWLFVEGGVGRLNNWRRWSAIEVNDQLKGKEGRGMDLMTFQVVL